MDYRLLGPLEVVDDGGDEIALGAGRQRALLALLVLRANETVSRDRLLEELWGESPPPTANKMLHNQVSALRRALGQDGALETRGSGYRLTAAPGDRDVDRFEELLARARQQLADDPAEAEAALRKALSLWRGPPLSDLTHESFAQREIARLEERRLVALEEMIEANLALGRHADVVGELEAALAQHPWRERLHGQLMLALYRSGRQAEALEAYRRARATLVDEFGLEPGSQLRSLQAAILAQDPSLDAPPAQQHLPAGLGGGSPLLAGRDRELHELAEALAAAREGRGRVVRLCGPRGIGKTRLAAELARQAHAAGTLLGYVRAGEPLESALETIRRVAESERPALLVLDDTDDMSPAVLAAAAEAAADCAGRPLLVLALQRDDRPPPALARIDAQTITLGPLGDEEVAQIARLYLPGDEHTIPLQALVAEAGGLPLAAHRAAREWARAAAADRLVATAGRAASGRSDLRAAEAELAGNVIELQAVRDRARRYEADEQVAEGDGGPPAAAICPFRGLATFDAAHADLFFGRERLVAELVARLVGAGLLAVVGPSGSGKSSAVRAGLLPALAGGVLPGSERWHQLVIRPGEHPLEELERGLSRAAADAAAAADDGEASVDAVLGAFAPDERLLLAVDQFEEVFTACRDEHERAAFVDALVAAARDGDRRAVVVLALRADFYGRCAAYPELADLVGANQVLVGPMRRDELRRAIELPARRVGLHVEPALTDVLIADVLDEPGGLPLLSTALLELWSERDGRVMRRAAYERTGGVRGAVARLAEETYRRLSQDEQGAARRILVRLADAGEEAAFVRRRVALEELELERDADGAAALAQLADSRLVTVHDGAVEVAHEALLREWPRLRGWLEEDAAGRRLHQQLIHAARGWHAAGRDSGELYRGARLASALEWMARHEQELNELEREFLGESRAHAELAAERQRQANRRLRALLGGVGALLALAVVAGVVALSQRGQAREAAVAADAQRLGAEALTDDRLDRALLLARTGVALHDTVQTRGNLLAALLRSPAAIGVMRGDGDRLLALALSPDDRTLAVGDNDGTIFVLDRATRRPLGRHQLAGGTTWDLEFSPDGGTLAVAGVTASGGAGASSSLPVEVLRLLDARSGRLRKTIELGTYPGDGRLPFMPDVSYSPQRDRMVVGYSPAVDPGGPAPTYLRLLDIRRGRFLGRPIAVGRRMASSRIETTGDRRRLFVTGNAENATYVVDARTLRILRRHPAGASTVAASADGRTLAIGSSDGRVSLVDLRSGRDRRLRGRHDAEVHGAAFSPDAGTLATTGDDGRVLVWDVQRGNVRETLEGHAGRVLDIAVADDGRTLYTAGLDGRVIGWDLSGDRRLAQPFSAGRPFVVAGDIFPPAIAVSADARTLAVAQSDGAVQLTDTRTLRRAGRIRALKEGAATAVDFAASGRMLAVTGESGDVTLLDVRTRRAAGLGRMPALAQTLDFSPDGRSLLVADVEGNVKLWNVRTRVSLARPLRVSPVLSATFAPDGRRFALTSPESGTEIRDARTLRRVATLPSGDDMRSAAFSPDGRLIATGTFEGAVRLWSTDTWRPVARNLEGHEGFVLSVSFSPDSRTLATSGTDGTTVLWDVASERPIGSALGADANRWTSAVFSPAGSHLFAVSETGRALRWEISPAAWNRQACLAAGRNLTRREWAETVPRQPYRRTCPAP